MGLEIRSFQPLDTDAVVLLWQQCELTRPWNDPYKDIQRKLQVQPELFLVGLIASELVATLMAGYEGHRGWLNYLAVASTHRQQGIGKAMVHRAEQLLREIGCPKINLQVRSTNQAVIDFYRQLGYSVDEAISLGKRLEIDQP